MSDQPERALRIPEWVFAAISYALYALLLESVVEGFVLGSEIRWIALGVVGLYAVASYGLWNRVGPRAKAVASSAVLLALAAASAWRLGSAAASGGYSVATLSGSRLAELLSAGALMVGFLAVWPLAWVPERHRVKVRVLLVALMAAPTLSGLGLPHLTSRLSLPGWPSFQLRSGDAEPGYAKDVTSEEIETIAEQVERGLEALAEEAQQIPRDSFDLQAIIVQVGKDPGDLFEWVRDHTYWVPYRGSLRGPLGVLMDRTGNSLDRSLLLAELLRLAGGEARLAHAQLDEFLGGRLLSQLRVVPDQPLPGQEVDAEASQRRLGELSERLTDRVAAQVPLIFAGGAGTICGR